MVFRLGMKGRVGAAFDDETGAESFGEFHLPEGMIRHSLDLPELSQVEAVRHFTRLSQMSWGSDLGPYPLGSCTMKYNPRVNEDLARLDSVQWIHPSQGEAGIQGALEVMHRLDRALASVTGMSRFTLQPSAGAHGELTGCLIIRQYHKKRGDIREEIIVPDSAHGTNPASASMAGFRVVEVPTGDDGCMDLEMLKSAVSDRTAGLMMTNPNTLGIFEERACEIAEIVHDAGGLLYYDGANLQGIIGRARPRDLGFDVVHLNLHKTFSTPHGGGGPGAGPIGVRGNLEAFLPVPLVEASSSGTYRLNWDRPDSIGKVGAWYGNFPILVRAYAYLLSMGIEGLKASSGIAVLNTNYFASRIAGVKGIAVPFGSVRKKHEVIVSVEGLTKETGVTALDVSKALLDRGLHAPTIYFPLIVKEAMMFEFTDTETKENIDLYVEALREICAEAYSKPESVTGSPTNTAVGRLDEVRANHPKTMCLSYRMLKHLQ